MEDRQIWRSFFHPQAHGKILSMSPKKQKLKVDLVIPIFNEAEAISQTYADICRVVDALPFDFNFIYVDDGSSDGTVDTLRKIADDDPRISLLQLSRNFGHQAALTAGMDASTGDVMISLDGDGQHPPEMIPQMLELIQQGYDIVQAQRMEDDRSVSFKKVTSNFFYWLINKISGTQVLQGAADFRALSRNALNGVRSMHEYHRFLRGMISWMGYKSVILPYHEPARIAGKSKYSLGKMVRLASDAIFSFSLAPLYIGLSAGLGILYSGRRAIDLCSHALADGQHATCGTRLEFVDGHPAHRKRHHHDPAWVSLVYMLGIFFRKSNAVQSI